MQPWAAFTERNIWLGKQSAAIKSKSLMTSSEGLFINQHDPGGRPLWKHVIHTRFIDEYQYCVKHFIYFMLPNPYSSSCCYTHFTDEKTQRRSSSNDAPVKCGYFSELHFGPLLFFLYTCFLSGHIHSQDLAFILVKLSLTPRSFSWVLDQFIYLPSPDLPLDIFRHLTSYMPNADS